VCELEEGLEGRAPREGCCERVRVIDGRVVLGLLAPAVVDEWEGRTSGSAHAPGVARGRACLRVLLSPRAAVGRALMYDALFAAVRGLGVCSEPVDAMGKRKRSSRSSRSLGVGTGVGVEVGWVAWAG
jgi:hypothetical protein